MIPLYRKERYLMKVYNEINDNIIKEIVNTLECDGLIIIPTDTVYGIACNAFSDKAIEKIYNIKKRNMNKPIGILTNSEEKLLMVVDELKDIEKKLIKDYFPGQLTIICKKKQNISNILTANKETIGIRIPNDEIALKILSSYPYPLAVTSANISGEKSCIDIGELIKTFKDSVDIVIDGGKRDNLASTIIQVENNKISIIRQGNIQI